MMRLKWQWIDGECDHGRGNEYSLFRLEVPGGWLVRSGSRGAECIPQDLTFISDPDHAWGREGQAHKPLPYTADGRPRCQEMCGTRSQCYLPVGHNIPCDFVALPDST